MKIVSSPELIWLSLAITYRIMSMLFLLEKKQSEIREIVP